MKHTPSAATRRKNPKPTREQLERRRLRDHARLAEAWRELTHRVQQ